MRIQDIVKFVTNKENFNSVKTYIEFAEIYLKYIDKDKNLQAIIISQNETNYRFFQYGVDATYNITRPINSDLFYDLSSFRRASREFIGILKHIKDPKIKNTHNRDVINNTIYTIQQCIGAALDALPSNRSNTARKINGDLFERLIRIIISDIGIDVTEGTIKVPVMIDGEEAFKMSYQHDLIINMDNEVKAIGSVKTSSKDRIDKIFIDKFLYNKLTEKDTPHFAIFLNDVQRKNTKKENKYGISATFLPGHFKGYTIKLNPLDGVYYCDIRPNMKTDKILKKHIKTFDYFLFDDVWKFI